MTLDNEFKKKYSNTNKLIQSPYDKRDYKFKSIITAAFNLPDNYESPQTPFVFDQGTSSMCCACAYNTIRFLQENDTSTGGSGINIPFSPAFTYANRDEGQDYEGMIIRDCCAKGVDGSLPYNKFPGFMSYTDAKKVFSQNKNEFLKEAAPFKIDSYYICGSRNEVRTAIITTKAVLIGIPVYDCLYEPDANGYIHYDPHVYIDSDGGHAVILVGWKIDENGKLWWIMQNSWGRQYGNKGRVYLPEDYPWIDNAYALVDNVKNINWEEYKQKYMTV